MKDHIVNELANNKQVFQALFSSASNEMVKWKPAPEKWSLLEIICHLYDEEREDFRGRIKHIFDSPDLPLPPIDPQGWVQSRNYSAQDYHEKLNSFLEERDRSIIYLQNLSNPDWDKAIHHPVFGTMTTGLMLANWLAHDYLHFRQITRLKYQFLQQNTGENLSYAGEW